MRLSGTADPVFIKKKRSPAGEMRYLARRNIAGHRKRFLLTVLSLFLGLETFLWAVVITSGSDYAHVIEQRPDFLIAGQFGGYGREHGYGEEYKTRDAGQDPMLTEGSGFDLLYDNAPALSSCTIMIMMSSRRFLPMSETN